MRGAVGAMLHVLVLFQYLDIKEAEIIPQLLAWEQVQVLPVVDRIGFRGMGSARAAVLGVVFGVRAEENRPLCFSIFITLSRNSFLSSTWSS